MIQVRGNNGVEQRVSVQTVEPESLISALDQYDYVYRELRRLERSTARMMLDKLDEVYPPSPKRDEMREYLLDRLAWQSGKVAKWLKVQWEELKTPSPASSG